MNRFYIVTLLAMFALAIGCGGEAASEPSLLDAQTRDAILQEDQAINTAEEQR